MKQDYAEEYTQSLGQIVAGSWRQIALAKKLGVPKALGLSTEDWVNKRLGGYVKMSIADRREAMAELSDEMSNREIAGILGVDETTVRRDAANAAVEGEDFHENNELTDESAANAAPIDAVAALMADDKIRITAKATATRKDNEEKRKDDLERPVSIDIPSGITHGDFYIKSSRIPNESVELIFTDPPYDADSVDLYGKAAEVAARILKPGGSFIAYSGQRHLPKVLNQCSQHLDYWWTIADVHSGGKQIMQKLGIRVGWKPMVWFVKGTRGDIQKVLQDTVTGDREKDTHQWQQAEAEAIYYIDQLTPKFGTVVDFFLGGGTTAVAAEFCDRNWIGFEIDAAAVESSTKRLQKAAA